MQSMLLLLAVDVPNTASVDVMDMESVDDARATCRDATNELNRILKSFKQLGKVIALTTVHQVGNRLCEVLSLKSNIIWL